MFFSRTLMVYSYALVVLLRIFKYYWVGGFLATFCPLVAKTFGRTILGTLKSLLYLSATSISATKISQLNSNINPSHKNGLVCRWRANIMIKISARPGFYDQWVMMSGVLICKIIKFPCVRERWGTCGSNINIVFMGGIRFLMIDPLIWVAFEQSVPVQKTFRV